MPLTIYRYHRADCKVHTLGLDGRTKRLYRDCDCVIWITGRTAKNELWERQSTKLRDWAAAEALRLRLDKEGQDDAVHGPTIGECVARYLEARGDGLNERVLRRYRLLLARLQAFAESRGAWRIQELTVDMLEDFRLHGLPSGLKPSTRRTAMMGLGAFLRVAHRRGWLPTSLADRLDPVHVEYEPGEPFEPAEVERILAAATGTIRLRIELMLATGMRVSDAVKYHPANAGRDESGVWVYPFTMTKRRRTAKPKKIEAYLPEPLKLAIDGCEWLSPKLPFWPADITDRYQVGIYVYDAMQKIGKAASVSNCRPHRCRDTAAVRWLLSDVSVSDVSRLLGHSSVATTEAHYLRWIPQRQTRLAGIVAKTLKNPVDG
jgi:integrase/recombinase XerD